MRGLDDCVPQRARYLDTWVLLKAPPHNNCAGPEPLNLDPLLISSPEPHTPNLTTGTALPFARFCQIGRKAQVVATPSGVALSRDTTAA